jgi:hypothetical protein
MGPRFRGDDAWNLIDYIFPHRIGRPAMAAVGRVAASAMAKPSHFARQA